MIGHDEKLEEAAGKHHLHLKCIERLLLGSSCSRQKGLPG